MYIQCKICLCQARSWGVALEGGILLVGYFQTKASLAGLAKVTYPSFKM